MTAFASDQPGAADALGEGCADGVVCFAGVDWWYHNRGHSECQIMRRLARRVPVLWVNSIGMRRPTRAKSELVFRRYVRKLGSTLKGLRRDESGMWVYSPMFVPRYTPRMVELNARSVGAQARVLARVLGIRRPAAWVTIPTAAGAMGNGWSRVVFNRSDEFSAFPEADASLIRPLEGRLLSRADHVVYVNRVLYERERSGVKAATFVGHGVDYGHFAIEKPAAGLPAELRDLPGPVIGFYGALDAYTIDLDLMIKTARAFPQGTLLVIGPKAMDISRLLKEPNVVYLGPIQYARLPAYAAAFDVGIMPWLRNEWIRGCNPIKLKEYLALGFPIVTVRFPELACYDGLVYGADSDGQFLDGVRAALAERDPQQKEARRQSVRADSWDSIADTVARMLDLAGNPK